MGSTSSGILSGVFNFVSREFESFVANATGSEPSTSQVLLDDFIDPEFLRETSPVEKETTIFRKPSRKSRQPQFDPSPKNEHETKSSRRKRTKKAVASSEEDDLPSKCSRHSPKPQLARSLKRRPSVSMPGSLFPRSPSMEPDSNLLATEREQHVRFASHVSQTPDPQSPQRYKSLSSRSLDGPAPASESPRRRSQIASSVKTAIDKFHIGQEDADSSILLPSPKRSPHSLVASRKFQSRRTSSPSSPSATPMRYKRKNYSVESLSDNCGDTSGSLHVKGKEKELAAAREELYKNERRDNEAPVSSVEQAEIDHNRDKARIKMLEEEIERLKQELSKRPVPAPFGAEGPPPPPPPPPPPHKKIVLNIPDTTSESQLFAAARASLKQAPTPVETPINPLIGRRAGQPTVGLAADKMAAFLNEMKTVRLRKVSERSSGDNLAPPFERTNAQSALRRSLPSQTSQSTIPLPTSIRVSNITISALNESENRMGEKRKRNTINIHDDADLPSKRRLHILSSSLASGSNSNLSSSVPTEDATTSSLFCYPPHSKVTTANRTWHSGSITDAPTPSLCSDNDIEREDISLDDQPPSTPPAPVGPSRNVYRFRGNGIPVEHKSTRQIHAETDKTLPITPGDQNFETSFLEFGSEHSGATIFDKRPPSSPLPNKSPRRPRPPSRIPRPTPQLAPPSRQETHSDEEDPLSLSFSSPDDTFLFATQRQTTSRSHLKNTMEPSTRSRDAHSMPLSRRISASQVTRRRTLDEELRDVPIGHHEDFDEAVLTGLGTRSKRHGFLAHGGAGGAPVFMGVGYVEGAEGNGDYVTYAEADADDEYYPTGGRSPRQ